MARRRAAARDLTLPPVTDPERRARCLADAPTFLRTYFPSAFFNPWTEGQLEMIQTVVDSARFHQSQAIAAPRGDGKTTVACGAVLYSIVCGYIDFAVIVAATGQAAADVLEIFKWLLTDDCHLLGQDFPEVVVPLQEIQDDQKRAIKQTVDGKSTKIQWTKSFLQLPTVDGSSCSGAIIYPRSIKGGIRGRNVRSRRPDFVLLDDPETAESASSPYQIGVRENILNKDIAGLKGQNKNLGLVALVTIQTPISLAALLTDRDKHPSYNGIRRSQVLAWPTNAEMWDEYMHRRLAGQRAGDRHGRDATAFYLANRQAMDDGVAVSNPFRYDMQPGPEGDVIEHSAIQAAYNFIAQYGREAFECEYQNNPHTDIAEDVARLTADMVQDRHGPYRRAELPMGTIGLTIAIDVGKYACHWTEIAWRPDAECHVVDYGVQEVQGLGTDSSKAAMERAIAAALSEWYESIATRELVAEDGTRMTPSIGLVDSGDGVMTDAIYNWIRGRSAEPRMLASKGYGSSQAPSSRAERAPKGTTTIQGRHWHATLQPSGVFLYRLDADYWKAWVHERLATEIDPHLDQQPMTLRLFEPSKRREHHSFARHLMAEHFEQTFVEGKGMRAGWRQTSPNNHWLDATYMACVAGAMLGLFQVSPTTVPQAHVPQSPEKPAAPTPRQVMHPRRVVASHPQGRPFVARGIRR